MAPSAVTPAKYCSMSATVTWSLATATTSRCGWETVQCTGMGRPYHCVVDPRYRCLSAVAARVVGGALRTLGLISPGRRTPRCECDEHFSRSHRHRLGRPVLPLGAGGENPPRYFRPVDAGRRPLYWRWHRLRGGATGHPGVRRPGRGGSD